MGKRLPQEAKRYKPPATWVCVDMQENKNVTNGIAGE